MRRLAITRIPRAPVRLGYDPRWLSTERLRVLLEAAQGGERFTALAVEWCRRTGAPWVAPREDAR